MNPVKQRAGISRSSIIYGTLGALFIGISAAYFLHRYPIRIPALANPEKAASFVIRGNGAQVMLLVDTSVIRQSWSHKTLSGADFSYGWTNTLQQEFGYFDIRDVKGVDSAALADCRIVVCSESAQKSLAKSESGTKLISEFVSGGGMIVLDYPSAEFIRPLDIVCAEKRVKRQKLSQSELRLILDALQQEISGQLPDSLPVYSSIQNYSSATAMTRGNTCFDYISCDQGGILLTRWDFGRWITLTQQGLPNENLNTENRYSELGHSDKLETNDLVADPSYLNSAYPWADIMEKTIGNFLASTTYAPRWHTAPGVSSGIFMMTHDDEGIGDAGAWMNVYENHYGYSSTSFLMTSGKLSAAGVSTVEENGGEIGLHWNRFERDDKASLETLGIGRWRPLARRRNLGSQIAWLDSLNVQPSYNRNHYFLWERDPFKLFRELNASGFTMDYSYGPDLNDKGYLFGSSFPFNPLDDNGASFRLLETPVTWTENFAGADSAWIYQLLADNAQRYHGVINALYHNNTFAWAPDYSIYESWKLSYDMAKDSRHVMFTASQLERFIESRSESSIGWQADSESVEVYCNPQQPDMALVVPFSGLYRPTVSIHDAGMNLSVVSVKIDSVSILGGLHWRISLPQGKFLLSFERKITERGGGR